jgi:hypothetical protein
MASTVSDKDSINAASMILDVSEFDFMKASYTMWFGEAPASRDIERAFSDYFDHGTIPFWTRAAARKVMDKCGNTDCDPEEFGLKRPVVDAATRVRGQWYIILLTIFLTAFFYMVLNTPVDLSAIR